MLTAAIPTAVHAYPLYNGRIRFSWSRTLLFYSFVNSLKGETALIIHQRTPPFSSVIYILRPNTFIVKADGKNMQRTRTDDN